jgi:WD40 repeat protein
METRCSGNGPGIGLAPSLVIKARFGARSFRSMPQELHLAAPISPRKSLRRFLLLYYICLSDPSKVWDTYSGNCLHSFPHNHIVRSVALSPQSSVLLTGGQEKKVRLFDLNRPDAEPDFLHDSGPLSHDGTIKSVVWVGDHTGVTAGEDGKIKSAFFIICVLDYLFTFCN